MGGSRVESDERGRDGLGGEKQRQECPSRSPAFKVCEWADRECAGGWAKVPALAQIDRLCYDSRL